MMFNNLGLCIRPRRRFAFRRAMPTISQYGGNGTDIFVNSLSSQPGPQGPQGVSVTDATVTDNPGDLILTLSDGTEINAGNVKGPKGDPGAQGPVGPTGATGNCNFFNVTLVDDDYYIKNSDTYVGAITKNIEITLLPGTTGRVFYIKNQSNGNIKVVGTGGQSIDGSSFQTLGSNGSMNVVFDGFRWNII